jgi:uncharacterized membrane protein YccF (DUF307 family)
MTTIVNVLWFVLAGFWLALGYIVAGVLAIVFIVTIPIAIPAFRMAAYVLWPFGRTIVPDPNRGAISIIGNVVWAVLLGWELALAHLITGVLLCVTVIGIPAGLVNFKLIPVAFAPYGKLIVPTNRLVA